MNLGWGFALTWLALGGILGFVFRPIVEAGWKSLVDVLIGDDPPVETEIRKVRVAADVMQLSSGKLYTCDEGSGSGRAGRHIAVLVGEVELWKPPEIPAAVRPVTRPVPDDD